MVFGIDCDIEPPHTRQFCEFHSLPLLSPASPCKISLLLITIPESLFIDLIKAHTKTLTIVIGSWFNMKKKNCLCKCYIIWEIWKNKRGLVYVLFLMLFLQLGAALSLPFSLSPLFALFHTIDQWLSCIICVLVSDVRKQPDNLHKKLHHRIGEFRFYKYTLFILRLGPYVP